MSKHRHWIEASLLLLILAIAAWRILTVGLSEHYDRLAALGDDSAIERALMWNERNPDALYRKARMVAGDDPLLAMRLLQRTLMLNPVNAHALVLLANLQLAQNMAESADISMESAVALMPASSSIRMQAANYWSARGQLELVLENWNAALLLSPQMGAQVFPSLMQVLSSTEGIKLLRPYADAPPVWWDGFFSAVAKQAEDVRLVIGLAALRHESRVPLSKSERSDLVERLLHDQNWAEAYLVWVNGLTSEEKHYLGGIYNGSFELPPTGKGFDWHMPEVKNVSARFRPTYGADGKNALSVQFRGNDNPFSHLYQQMFLSKGLYQFQARVRVDSLRTKGGLRWVIRCAADQELILGQSERLVGASDWDSMHFTFEVPARRTCASQILRFESVGESVFDHRLEGEVWFDQVQVFSKEPSTAAKGNK